jgi:peptidoglycan/LPS O-acetylase OafA/YrhL
MEKPFSYYPQLDSFRAIACLSVILFHSNTVTTLTVKNSFSFFKGGFLGVDLFFVLSGYLITSLLLKEFNATNTISIKKFYYKRVLRLYPPILLSVLLFLVPYLFVDFKEALSNMFFVLTYTSDVVRLFQYIYPALQYPLMFSHTWSLAIEEQFYIFYPLVFLWITEKYSKKEKNNIINSFPLFTIIFLIIIVISTMLLGDWFYKFFIWRFFEIFFGAYVAFIFSKTYQEQFGDNRFSLRVRNAMKAVYLNRQVFYISLLVTIYLINFYPPFYTYNLHYLLITLTSTVIIINFVDQRNLSNTLNKILLNSRLVYVGKISYGLYLYNSPIFHLQNKYFPFIKETWYMSLCFDLLTFFLTFIISILSYELLEKKILAYKRKISFSI